MLRAVVIALLVLGACKSSDKAAGDLTNAGKVVEASGDVKVHGKPVAVGQVVAADDTVDTGADGRVVIVLAHNNARWELGPNKHEKVSQSIAWGMAKQSGSAGTVTQDMTAAGRQAERSAADTTSTAPAQAAAPPMAEPEAKEAPPAAAAAPAPAPEVERKDAPPARIAAPQQPTSPSMAHVTRGGSLKQAKGLDDEGGGGPSPADTAVGDMIASPAFQACIADHPGIGVEIDITAKGTATSKLTGTVDAKTRSCIEKIVKATKFPKTAATVRRQLP